MRKILTILAVLVVILGVVGAVYFFYFRPQGQNPSRQGSLPTATSTRVTVSFSTTTPATLSEATTTSTGTSTSVTLRRLIEVSPGPVVPGAVVVRAATSSSAEVRFILRQSGNVFSYSLTEGVLTRINNKTLPGIQTASWFADGSRAVVRYLSGTDTVNTYVLPAEGGSGFFLKQGLSDVRVATGTILTLTSSNTGSTLSSLRADGSKETVLLSTPLSSLRLGGVGKQVLLFTKPSETLSGAAFIANTDKLERVGKTAAGLVALMSPSGKWVLESTSSDGSMTLSLVNASSSEIVTLPVATITDKCVWSVDESAIYCAIPVTPPTARYPDDWYRGRVSFNDRIWKIHVRDRYAELILDFENETDTPLDAWTLSLDARQTILTFTNKRDGSLWAFRL